MADQEVSTDEITRRAHEEANKLAEWFGQLHGKPNAERTLALVILASRIYATAEPPPTEEAFVAMCRSAYQQAREQEERGMLVLASAHPHAQH